MDLDKTEWSKNVLELLKEFDPILHGSVYYGFHDENSDIDISVSENVNIEQVISALKDVIVNYRRMNIQGSNLKASYTFIIRNGPAIDISIGRPTLPFYQEELYKFINNPEIKPIYQIVISNRELLSFVGYTKYRLMWLMRLWRKIYPNEITLENFLDFLKVHKRTAFVVDIPTTKTSKNAYIMNIQLYHSSVTGMTIGGDNIMPYTGPKMMERMEKYLEFLRQKCLKREQ